MGYAITRAYQDRKSSPPQVEVAPSSGSEVITQLCAELDNLMLDCHTPDWDGYGAKGISLDAYRLARRFILGLPAGVPRPSLSADADGCVTLEWQASPRRLVLVSVHPDYRIEYAAIFGNARNYGTEPFFDRLPTTLHDLIRRVDQA
jgi:hypothetical protein